MAPAATTTPKASTAPTDSTAAASSCVCSRRCPYPMTPPPAPSSCSAGESLSLRPDHSLHSSGMDAGKKKKKSGTTAWAWLALTFTEMAFMPLLFQPQRQKATV